MITAGIIASKRLFSPRFDVQALVTDLLKFAVQLFPNTFVIFTISRSVCRDCSEASRPFVSPALGSTQKQAQVWLALPLHRTAVPPTGRSCMTGPSNLRTNSVRTVGVPTEISILYLQNRNLHRYHYDSLLNLWHFIRRHNKLATKL